jgi:hypothetical protein
MVLPFFKLNLVPSRDIRIKRIHFSELTLHVADTFDRFKFGDRNIDVQITFGVVGNEMKVCSFSAALNLHGL